MPTTQPTLKHWRAFGAAEWGHVKDGAIGLLLGSVVPVGLFYVCYRAGSFSLAVVVVLVWSAAIFAWHYRRTGGADVFSATTFAFALVKAGAGLLSQNPWVYLAWPSLENMVYGTSFLGSALLGKPLLVLYAERLYPIPAEVQQSPVFRHAFVVTSAAWFCGHTLRAVVRLWLLAHLPLELYLVADTVAGWPVNLSLMAFTAWYPLRELQRGGFLSVAPQAITAVDAIELGLEEAAPTTV